MTPPKSSTERERQAGFVHSDIPTQRDLRELLEWRGGACVTFYLPTHRTGRDMQQDPIRFKNQLREAQEQLESRGLRRPDAEELLGEALALLRDDLFWQHQSDGLAVFCGDDFFRRFRLPVDVDELTLVNDRFHIKPLLPLYQGNGRFFVLALSQHNVRLFQATRHRISEVQLEGVPKSIEEVGKEPDRDETLQFHVQPPNLYGPKRAAIFHGHGGVNDSSKDEILQFFQYVDRGLSRYLATERAPLVLACVGYLAPIYESTNNYSNLFHSKVPGNPELWTEEELQSRAWQLVEPYFAREQKEAISEFWRAAKQNEASNDLGEIVLAAHEGRIKTLLFARSTERWGRLDPEHNLVEFCEPDDEGAEELLDYTAAETLAHDGVVYALDPESVPSESDSPTPVAAVLRYRV